MKSTLSTKMAVPGAVLAVCISLFVYVGAPLVLESHSMKNVEVRAGTIAEMTAVSASVGLFFDEYETVRSSVRVAQKNDDLSYLVIANAAGDVVAAHNLDEARRLDYPAHLPDTVIDDERVYVTHVMVQMQDEKLGEIYVGLRLDEQDAAISEFRSLIGVTALILLILGFAAIGIVSFFLTRPLPGLVDGSKRIADGEFTHRVKLGSDDEFEEISEAVNRLAEQFEESKARERALRLRLEAAEKAEPTDNETTAAIPTRDHELRTPLNGILGTAKMLMESDLTDVQRQMAELVVTSADALATLLAISVNDAPEPPVVKADPPTAEKAPDRQPEPGRIEKTSDPSDVRTLRILLAEDNPVNQRVMTIFCKRFGCHPDVVANGKLAIEALEARPYDVVFMDLHMPEMGGIEAARHIRADINASERPYVIALTADVTRTSQEACFNAGMSDFLAKPVTVDQVQDALARYMESEHRWLRSVNQQDEEAA